MPILETKNQAPNLRLVIKNRQPLVIGLLLVWGALSLLFFAARPQFNQIWEIKTKIENQRASLKQLQRKVQELEQLKLSTEFQQKDKVDEVFPSHKPLLELLANLSQAAKSSQVLINSFEISPGQVASTGAELIIPKNSAAYQALELDLTVRGSEKNVDDFLDLVEKISPITTITELVISHAQPVVSKTATSSATSNQTVIATARMTLETYYYTQSVKTTLAAKLPSVGEKEIAAFNTIQKFLPSDFTPVNQIQPSDLNDIFGVNWQKYLD